MKYAKELNSVMKKHPIHERIFLINYKNWKKVKNPGSFWKARLALQMFMTPKKLMDINLKTMYKLCKRFEKRKIENDSKNFYTMVSKIVSSKASLTDYN